MKVQTLGIFILAGMGLVDHVRAQNNEIQFQPRSAYRTEQSAESSVSQDLLDIYEKTKNANSEHSVTAIARACSKIMPNIGRTQLDRDYAASLLAWALNRRGEMRSERAAELVAQGRLAEADQLDNQAAEDFATAIEYGPTNWRTHHNFAISLAMKGEYRQAILEFTRTIELKPDYANSYFNRGELYSELEQYSTAIDDYSQALSLDGSDPQYFNSRGHCRFMMEHYDAAIADYETAAELGADSATYKTDLADAYQFLGKWQEAAKAYRAAVSANPKYARAYQNAAWLMATCPEPEFRNSELALASAKKAIELDGKRSPRSLDTLAAATAASGRKEEAAKLQQQALQLTTDEDERQELAQRLKLYQRGSVYRQPKPMANIASTPMIQENRIRTASSSENGSR